jgi:hypothetical protein
MWYAAVRRVGDNAHQKIVMSLPSKPRGRELSEERAAAVWDYWFGLVSPGEQAYLACRTAMMKYPSDVEGYMDRFIVDNPNARLEGYHSSV